ncbi:uncharacterized protein LOC112348275 [Selaginella moellendorffii]|uniref:uncharacterized protein LOC112348275 n=1 Tax=Selaginella moellendorffii TaxID=88036 RepID=UPI000D1C6D4E|nr:uncharacterized protein LOC112348275 [Selaginella moellendorffii]|eukprot:XP_024536247.1 uncharacterized protein LOC112348275 [Selaginella moellendorffii]
MHTILVLLYEITHRSRHSNHLALDKKHYGFKFEANVTSCFRGCHDLRGEIRKVPGGSDKHKVLKRNKQKQKGSFVMLIVISFHCHADVSANPSEMSMEHHGPQWRVCHCENHDFWNTPVIYKKS